MEEIRRKQITRENEPVTEKETLINGIVSSEEGP